MNICNDSSNSLTIKDEEGNYSISAYVDCNHYSPLEWTITTGTTCTHFSKESLIPVRVIYNPPYTICYFPDGTKEVVKCGNNEEYIREVGVMSCIMRKIFETRASFLRVVDSGTMQEGTQMQRLIKTHKKIIKKNKAKK